MKAEYSDFHLLLIWIPQRESLDGRLNLDLTNVVTQKAEKVIDASNSLERPMLLRPQPVRGNFENGCSCPTGKLQNGRRFFIYRVLLYSDGFSKYQDKQGSAGGVYMLPLNFHPSLRRNR